MIYNRPRHDAESVQKQGCSSEERRTIDDSVYVRQPEQSVDGAFLAE